ncbi:MAG: histidine--tRNA ligase [Proteobacteria bacterium]|nr:histidine--tRNA ligase [Pseudomonadota bacterium]
MSQKLQPVRGTQDILPEEFAKHRHVIDTARRVGALYGFKEMATPIFEFTEVFKRTLGETSDVVNKEMYTFEDKGGESITLRPEFTAGIARAFISGGLQEKLPIKYFSTGPLFRYERPQKGRYRQFHQINFEWLGNADPLADVELILMAADILEDLGILSKTKLNLNSLGDQETRQNYRAALVKYFSEHKNGLSEDSKVRLDKNPLRILDSKDEGDKKIVQNAPLMGEYYSAAAKAFFETVTARLKDSIYGDRVVINPKIVRGLDYYSHTVFEFIAESDELGSQNTVLAGGRYDGLIKTMGGPETPAVGFAAGIERLALMVHNTPASIAPVAIIPMGEAEVVEALKLASSLRHGGIAVEFIAGGNVGKAMKKADKAGAKHALILGSNELNNGKVVHKDLATGQQNEVSRAPETLIPILKK